MNKLSLFPAFAVSSSLALVFAFSARAEESRSSIKFSDAEKPGTVKILVPRGSLRITGSDEAEVSVKSDLSPISKVPRKDGLRVLTSSASFSLTEKDNVATLDAMGDGFGHSGGTFSLNVPRSSSVIVQNSWGGDVTCSGIIGDIEITAMSGSIRIAEASGGIVVSTMNGEIRAAIRELRSGKAISFQSMNGEISLRLPSEAKANLRVRTQNGSVLTDFDENVLVTKTENAGGLKLSHGPGGGTGQSILTPHAREAIREAARVGAEAVKEAAVAIREAAEAAREGAEAARHSVTGAPPAAPASPRPARLPKAMTMPTLTGGKLVTGTLNGGGPEINIATMNGDVTLRQAAKQ